MSLFDIIAPLSPFDKTASMVAGKGEHFHWEPFQEGKIHSADPLPVRPPTVQEAGQPCFVDLKGVKIGRFTVQGLSADIVSSRGANWVVRCVCGAYETRKAKFIKACAAGDNPCDPPPMCDSCSYTRRLQKGMHHPKKAAAAAEAIQSNMR